MPCASNQFSLVKCWVGNDGYIKMPQPLVILKWKPKQHMQSLKGNKFWFEFYFFLSKIQTEVHPSSYSHYINGLQHDSPECTLEFSLGSRDVPEVFVWFRALQAYLLLQNINFAFLHLQHVLEVVDLSCLSPLLLCHLLDLLCLLVQHCLLLFQT